ncbi:hypothetical protein, partial [Fusobacterium sp. SYSU M8D902]|uniref:hypothetical protein n=1 Tax=Fusobacterium sp. SYSU M8D902 TaxID=3159562 RepID=UPI0032E50D8A
KSKEVVGYVAGNKVIIPKEENPQVNFEDSYEIIDNKEGKISKEYRITKTEEGIEIEGIKVPEFLYLVGKTGTWKWNNRFINLYKWYDGHRYSTKNLEINDFYKGSWIENIGSYDGQRGNIIISSSDKAVKDLNTEYYDNVTTNPKTWLPTTIRLYQRDYYLKRINNVSINNKVIAQGSYNSNIVEIDDEISIQIGGGNSFKLRLIKYPSKNFSLTFYLKGIGQHIRLGGSTGDNQQPVEEFEHDVSQELTINFKYKPSTLKGQSSLTVREKYPTNQFIQFNSTEFEAGKPLALENSLTDVTFNTSGKGIVTMEEGDILEIDGKQVRVGASGNLGVQTATIGDLKYSYKVEAGKLRLSLNEWGVLEPNHNLMIRVFRNKDGKQQKMVEHTLTIDSPRRVEGANNIKIDN